MSRKFILLVLALLSLTAPAWASVIYVSGDQTGTWAADTVIVTGEVRVSPGQSLTISPGVEVLFSVYCKLIVDNGATLRAVGTAMDSIRFDVLPPDTAWHGIRFLSASDSSRLEYCYLTHGKATGSGEDNNGGAIYCSSSSPTIINNTISRNSAPYFSWPPNLGFGGGIYCGNNANPIISGNTISENSCDGGGGGIYCGNNANPIISGNTISEDSCNGGGGGIYCGNNSNPLLLDNSIIGNFAYPNGGAIFLTNSNPFISGNFLSGNTAYESGGGIYCINSNASILGNTLTGNLGNYYSGGGIYCLNGNPTINGNIIQGNSSNTSGGGICCTASSPDISGNFILENYCYAPYGGGGIYCYGGIPTISFNFISGNHSSFGGGIYCINNSPVIHDNLLNENYAETGGGGIGCVGGSPLIEHNTITQNRVFSSPVGHGGGICLYNGTSVLIRGNTISANSVNDLNSHGGGIYLENCTATLSSNTIIANSANQQYGGHGGGMYCNSLSTVVINCAFWGNSPEQFYAPYGSPPQVTYSDIQGGYPGTGNINVWPAFVDTAHDDYRLQWGSPCIDAGDPNPIYNDPDLTRADMGACYYDQSMPVRILLTPYNAPIEIPASGGSFQYALHLTNIATSTLPVLGWCNVTLPNGSTYGPVLGPLNVSVGPGQTLSRMRTQTVPASAPAGMYRYNAFAVAAGDTSTDSFVFTKSGVGFGESDLQGGWTNAGEEFNQISFDNQLITHNSSLITSLSPNPFNPSTAISFKLQAASKVSLKIYNTAGRLVTTLVDGWREAGTHEVTFDGSKLASGIYLYKLTCGQNPQTGKMVLLK
jgi:hypothetical protein